MKEITGVLLATLFVLYSLMVLVSVELSPDSNNSPPVNNEERISDVGLRFAFKR
jgi:hypothetical protein